MPDLLFDDPRMAELYDALDGPRDDLELYVAVRRELGARSVLDVGCGTGSLAVALAQEGAVVTGVDPAAAMVAVARRKDQEGKVRFVVGEVGAALPLEVDLVTMTGNVAQVFLSDKEWMDVLVAARMALAPGGHVVFESRVPEKEAWRAWVRKESYRRIEIAGAGWVETWDELVEVRLPFVTFASVVVTADGTELTSRSTLRFRSLGETTESLARAGFRLLEVRDAPDRPGLEHVYLARRQGAA